MRVRNRACAFVCVCVYVSVCIMCVMNRACAFVCVCVYVSVCSAARCFVRGTYYFSFGCWVCAKQIRTATHRDHRGCVDAVWACPPHVFVRVKTA